MAKPRLDANDFMADGTVSGRNLQGIDQAAIQAQNRLKEPYDLSGNWEEREKDYRVSNAIHKRSSQRGSAIFRRDEMMGIPPGPGPKIHK